MDRTVIEEKQMLGLKISKGKNLSASRHMRFFRRDYLKADKRGILCTYVTSFILITHEKGGQLCQRQDKSK